MECRELCHDLHTVSLLNDHMVFSPKYLGNVLVGDVALALDEKTASKFDDRYCIHCQDQDSGELASKEQVRKGSLKAIMQLQGKSREGAEKMVDVTMAKLQRWQKQEKTLLFFIFGLKRFL